MYNRLSIVDMNYAHIVKIRDNLPMTQRIRDICTDLENKWLINVFDNPAVGVMAICRHTASSYYLQSLSTNWSSIL